MAAHDCGMEEWNPGMSHALVNKVKYLAGFTMAEKSVLFQLADASHDGETVFLRMDRLCLYVGCSLSTAKRALRRLERRGVLIPQGSKSGRGTVHVWRFNLEPPPIVEEEPPITEELPPTNGTTRTRRNDLVDLFSKQGEQQKHGNIPQKPAH